MIRRAPLFVLAAVVALALTPASAGAAAAPAWHLSGESLPANLAPGKTSEAFVLATNVGAETTAGPITATAGLPEPLEVLSVNANTTDANAGSQPVCTINAQLVECKTAEPLHSGKAIGIKIKVKVPAGTPPQTLSLSGSVSGGGTAQGVEAQIPLPITASPIPFGFFPGLSAPLTEEDGSAATLAGSHANQFTVNFSLPSEVGGGQLTGTEHAHDILTELPRGLLGDPAASLELCTEAELTTAKCPPTSVVGTLEVTTWLGSASYIPLALFAMVPPPGAPAAFATEIAGYYVHLIASVRTDGDYGVTVASKDTLAVVNPIFAIQAQIWGDPSSPVHDWVRGHCTVEGIEGKCPVEPQHTAFLTLPSDCPGHPIVTGGAVDSWEQPGVFRDAEYESADLAGNPVAVTGCDQLEFEPTISAQPTTNLADSPSGLDVDLHQPQDFRLGHRATAELKDAKVTLPVGMAVNPSQADGLAVCTEQQIGLLAEDEEAGIHFSKQPQSCPDAAKLGSAEVTSPLLVQRDAEQRLQTDPQTGEPLPEPLQHGSVYIAKPFENPFGSLLAIYLAIEDPKTGIVAKLAGRVEADPQTGQLTTSFEENPELPLEDVKLHLFGGSRGSLITPPVCGTHTTTTTLTPWSSPESADAHPQSSFQVTGMPGGGACPSSDAQAPNSPFFTAGTLNPQAGAYSPLVLKLSREDGSQRLAGIDTTLAPGLIGKLAGIGQCSDAQIAQAEARHEPEEGRLEREAPSCPLSSEVGVVNVGAGAGPNPYYTQGHAYLAGPYKGAPVSLAVIVPAVAGPFDLGTVVTRVALHVEPETAQIHAVSDPLPQILDGIPLDVRSVALEMNRPQFTLNPTSCDPLAITGSLTSALGQAVGVTAPFQVGGCQGLAFKPKLSLRLKGSVKRSSTPRLIATLKAKPGEANIAAAQVKLPHPVFLDQAHIRTICTRVQFAADTCPAGSVYGKAEATTTLLDHPLSGSVYLRSSSHQLPDLVAKLRGPASQPIEIDLAGKTDAVKGALRNTFEAVPDAPVSSFRLELFGGKRGLVEMSDGFCADRHANVQLTAQSGKVYATRPVVAAKCPKKHKGKKQHGSRRHGR